MQPVLLAGLNQLTSLKLVGCKQVSDLSPLASLTQLSSLDLSYCQQVSDLNGLANLNIIVLIYQAIQSNPSHMEEEVREGNGDRASANYDG